MLTRISRTAWSVITRLGAWAWYRFVALTLVGKAVAVIVLSFLFAKLLATLGLTGLGRGVGRIGVLVLSVLLAGALMAAIWDSRPSSRRRR